MTDAPTAISEVNAIVVPLASTVFVSTVKVVRESASVPMALPDRRARTALKDSMD